MSDLFSSRLSDLSLSHNLSLDHTVIWKLSDYFSLALKWGEKINITANLGLEDYLKENVLDPLLALKNFQASFSTDEQNPLCSILDVGCGGGFTGLTWAIILGDTTHVTLIDRDRRKINFCRQVIRELALPNVKAHHSDFSSFDLNNLKHPLTLVSRATFGASDFFHLANKYGRPDDTAIYCSTPTEATQLSQDTNLNLISYNIDSTTRCLLIKKL